MNFKLIQIHKIHHDLDLRKITILLPIVNFIAPHKGYIKMALKVSKPLNYECHQFFVLLCDTKLTLNTIKSNTSTHMKTCA
jgi:hypothetical protein